jgi:uncharacterized membrane protein YgcG
LRATNSLIAQPLIAQTLKCDAKCKPEKPTGPHNPQIEGECSDVCYRLAERRIKELSFMLLEHKELGPSFDRETIRFSLIDPKQPKWVFRFQGGIGQNLLPMTLKFNLRNNRIFGNDWSLECRLSWCISSSEYEAKEKEWDASNQLSNSYFKNHPRAWPGPREDFPLTRQSRREHKQEENLTDEEKVQIAFAARNKLHFNENQMSYEQRLSYRENTQNLIAKIEDSALGYCGYSAMKKTWILSRVPPVLSNAVTEFSKRFPFFTETNNVGPFSSQIVNVQRTENGPVEEVCQVILSCPLLPDFSQRSAVNFIWALRKPINNFSLIDFTPQDNEMPLARSIKNWWNINLGGYNTTRMVLAVQNGFGQPEEPSDWHPYNGAPLVESKKNNNKTDNKDEEEEEEEEKGKERKSETGPGLSSLSSLLAPLEGGGQAGGVGGNGGGQAGGGGGGGGGQAGGGGGQRAHYKKNEKKTAGKKRKTRKRLFTKKKKTMKKK